MNANPRLQCAIYLIVVANLIIDAAFGQTPGAAAAPAPPKPFVSGPNVGGRVLSSDGKPTLGAKVYLLRIPEAHYTLPTKPLMATTKEDGRFLFKDVEPERYQVWAENDDSTTLSRSLSGKRVRVEHVAPESTDPLVLELHPGCGYDVTILDAETKKPIKDARITFGWPDIAREYVTDASGKSKIRQLSSNDWYFVVEAKGYGTEFLKTSKQDIGTVLPVQIELGKEGALKGTVNDDTGKPIAGAEVWFSLTEIIMSPSYGKVITNERGEWTMSGLPLKRKISVRASHPNYEYPQEITNAIASKGSITQVLKTKPAGVLVSLIVIDEAGKPIEGAWLFGEVQNFRDAVKFVTDGTGQINIDGLRDDSITVKAKGFVAKTVSIQSKPNANDPFAAVNRNLLNQPKDNVPKDNAPKAVNDRKKIMVQLVRGKTLRGRLLTDEGKPAPNTRIYFDGGEMGAARGGRVLTNDDGHFEIDGLQDRAKLSVYASTAFAPIRDLDVSVDEANVLDIKMEPSGCIAVRAVDAKTIEPLEQFNVRVFPCENLEPEDPKVPGITVTLTFPGKDIQGTTKVFRMEGETIGTPYKLRIAAMGFEPKIIQRVTAESIRLSKVLDVPLERIRPEDYQPVAGQLLDADGRPIAGASVRLLVGAAVPLPGNPNAGRNTVSGWKSYHWNLITSDYVDGSDKCVQLLKAVSDQEGRFVFEPVKKGTPWLELLYFGDGLMSQRYWNLRKKSDDELRNLVLTAARPGTLEVKLNREAYPNVKQIVLQASNAYNGPSTLLMPFGYQTESFSEKHKDA